MKVTRTILLVFFVLAMGAKLSAQFRPPPAFDIDITGYWTPPLHEDGLERGNGPEIADYGGFALNEAGRLFALSYDPSRLTLRSSPVRRLHHALPDARGRQFPDLGGA